MTEKTLPLTPRRPGDRLFVVAILGALVVVGGLIPLAGILDDRTDRQRAMYTDIATMTELQRTQVRDRGALVAVSVGPGETVAVGDSEFTSSPGVSLEVRAAGSGDGDDEGAGGICVRAENEHGDQTAWRCVPNVATSEESVFPPGLDG